MHRHERKSQPRATHPTRAASARHSALRSGPERQEAGVCRVATPRHKKTDTRREGVEFYGCRAVCRRAPGNKRCVWTCFPVL